MPTVGLLYPGHSAEDDFHALEARLAAARRGTAVASSAGEVPAIRLPLVHTSVGEDAHRSMPCSTSVGTSAWSRAPGP